VQGARWRGTTFRLACARRPGRGSQGPLWWMPDEARIFLPSPSPSEAGVVRSDPSANRIALRASGQARPPAPLCLIY
jgi:hypothetical protein